MPTDTPTDTPSDAPTTLGNITELKATKASQLTAVFDTDVPGEYTVEVTKGNTAIDGKYSVNETAKNTIIFDATANFASGTYTFTAKCGDTTRSQDVEIKDEYVAEIKVLNDVALTGKAPGSDKDATAAYIYYDVLNQYGESVRASEDIGWTTTPDNKTVDKSLGRITVTKDAGDTFTFGSQIYVVGVHVKSGTSISTNVTVGMAQAVNDVEFAGFLSKDDKTKILTELPTDFAKNTYVLLYKTFDQNGNPLDVSDEEFAGKNLTFVSNSPLLIKSIEKDDTVYTVNGEQYAAVKIEPGQYVDKGGEVTITAISNKTGKKSEKNFVVGTAALLKSLALSTPVSTVADGDTGVKIPYTATDVNGNSVTNYETIVRSTNELKLSASENTRLEIKEEDDGTAGIYWADDTEDVKDAEGNVTRAAAHKPTDFSKDSADDGVDRSVSLTTVVVGGESNNLILPVSDTRRPTAIKNVTLNDDANDVIVDQGYAKVAHNGDWNDRFVFIDQYGADLDKGKALSFFKYTASHPFDGDYYYGIKADVTGNATSAALGLSDTVSTYVKEGEWNDNGVIREYGSVSFEIHASASESVPPETVRYSIVRSKVAPASAALNDWTDVSKVKTVTYTVLPIKSVTNPQIKNITKQELDTDRADKDNGSDLDVGAFNPKDAIGADVAFKNTECKYDVVGSYKGNTVTIPYGYIEIADDSDITAPNRYWPNNLTVSGGAIAWGDLYDFNTYKAPRKDTEKTLKLIVRNTDNGSVVKKNIALSDEPSAPTSVRFVYNHNEGSANKGTLKPSLTAIPYGASKVTGDANNSWNNNLLVMVYDQYGNALTDQTVEYTVSDIVESPSALTHKSGNFVVNSNGTENIVISGAEIGDTFKLTASVAGTKLTASVDVTVAADSSAVLSSAGDSDKALRALLGYDR